MTVRLEKKTKVEIRKLKLLVNIVNAISLQSNYTVSETQTANGNVNRTARLPRRSAALL